MKPADLVLYTVLVFTDPPPAWRRASNPVPRKEAAPIVARHWAMGRLAKLHAHRPALQGHAEPGRIYRFIPPPDTPQGSRIAQQ